MQNNLYLNPFHSYNNVGKTDPPGFLYLENTPYRFLQILFLLKNEEWAKGGWASRFL